MGLMKKLTSSIVASSLVFGLVGTAFAEWSPEGVNQAFTRMNALTIVKGVANPDGTVDPALSANLTRAQLVTIIVRAFGQEENSKLLAGAPAFSDSADHWASGEIAMAKAIAAKNGIPLGRTTTTFDPNGNVTAAEAIALVMKFLGAKPAAGLAWPKDFIQGALDAGLVSADEKAALDSFASSPASRGLAFYLADKAFSSYALPGGKTVYTTYVDTTAPTLSVDSVAASTEADSVTISGNVKGQRVLHVGSLSNAVTPDLNGNFTATVDLKMGENTILVHALDIAGNASSADKTITRVAGAIASVEAAAIEIEAGASADVAVAVKDANGNEITGAAVTGVSSVGTFADGKFTAGEKAGTGTLTLTAGEKSTEVNVTVKAGALSNLVVTPATVNLQAGVSQKFTAAGADKFGNEVAVSGVSWSASKGVMGGDGTFGATSDAAGTVTVTATSGGVSGTASATIFGVAAKVQIATPANVVADNASETTVTANVVDANGNVVTSYNGTVTFASSNTTAVEVKTASVSAVNGVATTTIVGKSSATATVLSASASGLAGTTVTFTPAAQTLSSIKFEVKPGTIGASVSSKATLSTTLLDQNGKKMLALPSTGAITVRLTSSDGTVVNLGTAASDSIVVNRNVTLDAVEETTDLGVVWGTAKLGSASITGVVTAPTSLASLAVTSVSVSSLIVGDASAFSIDALADKLAGESSTVTVRVLDPNGNQVTTGSGTVAAISLKAYNADGTDVTPSATTVSTTNGVGTATINWTGTNNKVAGTYTVKAALSGYTTAEKTITIAPNAAKKIDLVATPSALAANGTATSALKVKVLDNYDNVVTAGSYSVKIVKNSGGAGSTASFPDTTVATSNGEATVTVTATTVTGTDTYTATAESLNNATDSQTISAAILGAPNKVALVTSAGVAADANSFSGTAGVDAKVYVAIKDANTATLTGDNGTPVTVTVKDAAGVVLGTFTGTSTNGVAEVKVNLTKSSSTKYTLEATSGSLTKATGAAFLAIAPAAATTAQISSDVSTLTASSSAKARIKVTLKDQFGNTAVNGSTALDVFIKESTTSYGALGGTKQTDVQVNPGYLKLTIAASGSSISTTVAEDFTAAPTPGSLSIEAKATGLASSSVTLNSITTGDLASLTADTVANATTGDGTSTPQEVVVNLVDGSGNRRTTDSATAVKLTINSATGTTTIQVWDYATGLWVAYVPGTGVVATKGQVKFGITNTKADAVTYDLTTVAPAAIVTKTGVSGTFVAATATGITADASTPSRIKGNGIALTTVTARITDGNSNTVATASGTMTFEIKSGGDYATLLQTTAPIVNGVASVVAQSKLVTSESAVQIVATTDWNSDGTVDSSLQTTVFTVDVVAPTVTGTVAANKLINVPNPSAAGTATVIDVGDTIAVTFSEATSKPTLTADSFVISGGLSFGTGATFVWNGAGTVLTITLGTAPTITGAQTVTLASSDTITDIAGQAFGLGTLFTVPAAASF